MPAMVIAKYPESLGKHLYLWLPDLHRATQRPGQHKHRRISRPDELVMDLDASHAGTLVPDARGMG